MKTKMFVLTEDQQMVRELAEGLAQSEIRPRTEEVDHASACPAEGAAVLAEAGLLACTVPEKYGGAGLDAWSQMCVIEETAKECASTAWAVAASSVAAECVLAHGGETLKREMLPALVSGQFAAVAETAVQAERDGEGWALSGAARHVLLAAESSWYLVSAAADGAVRWFAVRGDAAGLQVRAGEPMLGLKGCPMGDLVLDRCPGEALDAKADSSVKAALSLASAAVSEGVAQGALAEAVAYVNQRVQFGKTIAQFENTQQVMAELLAKAQAARALVWDAAEVKMSGDDYGVVAAMAKIVASDAASIITRKCIQFMGGYGYSREYPVERKMRDAKMLELVGVTAEQGKASVAGAEIVGA